MSFIYTAHRSPPSGHAQAATFSPVQLQPNRSQTPRPFHQRFIRRANGAAHFRGAAVFDMSIAAHRLSAFAYRKNARFADFPRMPPPRLAPALLSDSASHPRVVGAAPEARYARCHFRGFRLSLRFRQSFIDFFATEFSLRHFHHHISFSSFDTMIALSFFFFH